MVIYSRRLGLVDEMLAAARIPQSQDDVKVYRYAGGYFGSMLRKRKRSLASVFANDGIIPRIVETIEWFVANEEWYLRRGIPYKLVILLHGPPGPARAAWCLRLPHTSTGRSG